MQKKEYGVGSVFLKYLLIVWFVGIAYISMIYFTDPGRSNILTKIAGCAGAVCTAYIEVFILKKMKVDIQKRIWGIIYLVLFTLDFSVVLVIVDTIAWIALLLLGGAILISIIIGAAPSAYHSTVTYYDSNNQRQEEQKTIYSYQDRKTVDYQVRKKIEEEQGRIIYKKTEGK